MARIIFSFCLLWTYYSCVLHVQFPTSIAEERRNIKRLERAGTLAPQAAALNMTPKLIILIDELFI